MPFANLHGVSLFFTDEGLGDVPIVLLHGWTCDSHDWNWQLPALGAAHRVIAFDARGHGHSSAPESGYAPRDFADDVIALLDQLEVERAVLVGHSLGGVVASLVAGTNPKRVAGVVAIDPPYGFDQEGAVRNLGMVAVLKEGRAGEIAADFFSTIEAVSTPASLKTWHGRRAMATPARVVADTFEGTHGDLNSVVNLPVTLDLIARRKAPTLVIHIEPQRAEWERLLLTDPLSKSIAFEGAGHWVHQERPDEVNAVLLDWIAMIPEVATYAARG